MLIHRDRRNRRQQQRRSVGCRVLHRHDADAAGAAGAVIDDDRSVEPDAQFVGKNARQRVSAAAGREREDDPDRLLLRLRDRQPDERRRQRNETNEHAVSASRLPSSLLLRNSGLSRQASKNSALVLVSTLQLQRQAVEPEHLEVDRRRRRSILASIENEIVAAGDLKPAISALRTARKSGLGAAEGAAFPPIRTKYPREECMRRSSAAAAATCLRSNPSPATACSIAARCSEAASCWRAPCGTGASLDERRRRAAEGRSVEPRCRHRSTAYSVPSRFEKHVVRTLSNPEGRAAHAARAHAAPSAQRHDHAERPALRHLALGRSGHRSRAAPAGDPRPGEAPAGVHARCARALSDGVAHELRRVRRQQRAAVLQRAAAGERAGAARAGLLRGMDRRAAFDPARGDRHRSEGEMVDRRGRGLARAQPQRAGEARPWTTR